MAGLVFDFDSTLVPCESLEVLLARDGALGAAEQAEIEAITNAGMEGRLDFETSLRQRLAIAQPTRAATETLAEALAADLTTGVEPLVEDLRGAGHEVWIVSGGFREILLATGRRLGLEPAHVQGVQPLWAADGAFADFDPSNGFLSSKVEGLRRLGQLPPSPRVGVGDGATDLALREAGLVDVFVAYTEHARREGVVAGADFEATNMEDLRGILGRLWS